MCDLISSWLVSLTVESQILNCEIYVQVHAKMDVRCSIFLTKISALALLSGVATQMPMLSSIQLWLCVFGSHYTRDMTTRDKISGILVALAVDHTILCRDAEWVMALPSHPLTRRSSYVYHHVCLWTWSFRVTPAESLSSVSSSSL